MKTRYGGAYGGPVLLRPCLPTKFLLKKKKKRKRKRTAIVKVSTDTPPLSTTLFSNFLLHPPMTFDANEPCASKVKLQPPFSHIESFLFFLRFRKLLVELVVACRIDFRASGSRLFRLKRVKEEKVLRKKGHFF